MSARAQLHTCMTRPLALVLFLLVLLSMGSAAALLACCSATRLVGPTAHWQVCYRYDDGPVRNHTTGC